MTTKNQSWKVGDVVRYFPVARERVYSDQIVEAVYPDGIPSCREPMLKLRDKPGVVLASHCEASDRDVCACKALKPKRWMMCAECDRRVYD